jgi:serine/threonine protein kinase
MCLTSDDVHGRTPLASLPQKKIQLVGNTEFARRYVLGSRVMPSGHHDMDVKYATRVCDKMTVVVKLRYKPNCFDCIEEEREWRRGTEFMLNLPVNRGVARIFEVLEDSKAFYIITEQAAGKDLFELLSIHRTFSVSAAREILYKLLQGLEHLHQHKGIHKDIKLENVVVDAGMRSIHNGSWSPQSLKLIDFDTVEEWAPNNPPAKDVTGTNQYIAPEAYNGQYSLQSDIFAVGVIGYSLIVGAFPFRDSIFDDKPGENYVGCPKMEEIRRKLKVQKVNFNYPVFKENPQVADLLKRMLQYKPVDRPTVKQALESEWMANRSSEQKSGVTALKKVGMDRLDKMTLCIPVAKLIAVLSCPHFPLFHSPQ